MIDYSLVDELGEILSIGTVTDYDYSLLISNGELVKVGHYSKDTTYFVGDIPTDKGTPANKFETWDTINKEWVVLIPESKLILKQDVENLRKTYSPDIIVYDSKNIQADSTSILNILEKIAEINAAESVSETITPLIWRDADDVTHTFADMATYKAWLYGLIRAISERNTNLYENTWNHYDAIDALTTENDIVTYDVTTGW